MWIIVVLGFVYLIIQELIKYIKQNGVILLLKQIFNIIMISICVIVLIILVLVALFIIGYVADINFSFDEQPSKIELVMLGFIGVFIACIFGLILVGIYLCFRLVFNSCCEGIKIYNDVSVELNEVIISKTN